MVADCWKDSFNHFKEKMQIQVISTSVETKPTAKGSYQQLEVVYKNLTYQGKVESKKIMSFGAGAKAFTTLSAAGNGGTFDITVVKNAAGYNDWTDCVTAVAGAAPAQATAVPGGKASTPVKSTYETPEERAQRQVLIVRQSSVSSALTLHAMGAKSPPKLDEVLDTAQKISDFVFQMKGERAPMFEDVPDFSSVQVE